MFRSTIVAIARFFCLGFSFLKQALVRLLSWFQQTPARKLCQQGMTVVLVAGSSLLLLGNDSCNTSDEVDYAKTMKHVYDILTVHVVVQKSAGGIGRPYRSYPRLTGSDGSTTGVAGFAGNFTTIQGPAQGTMMMAREADCSLGLVTVANSNDPGTVTQHFEQVLHQAAGLTTTSSAYAKGCVEPSTGISSRPGVFIGATTNKVLVFAAAGPNSNGNAVFLYNSNNTLTETTVTTVPYATSLAAADLNGDQNNDLVVVNGASPNGATVSVLLANADGSFQSPVIYNAAGTALGNEQMAATIDDVNGDGKLDIIAVSGDQQISVLPGKGDGTFGTAISFAAPAVPGKAQSVLNNIITADVNGDGKIDLIGSNGLVLLGNGDGTFTAAGAAAFPYLIGVSNEGPNLAAGDVNNDGKVDLVIGNGETVLVRLGNGDGSFTAGTSYASVFDTGFVNITDVDGDGNPDIYVGMADNDVLGGDDSNSLLAYALMGNGDGTFRGAPLAPGAFAGNNLVDINNDGFPDLISNNSGLYGDTASSGTFTVALGSNSGSFATKGSVTAPDTFTLSGYAFSGVAAVSASGYAVGDVNGDGKPDLVFVDNNLTAKNPGGSLITYPYPVYFVALGNGDGIFQAATPYAFPQIAPASGFDNSLTVSGIQIGDFNKDGRPDIVLTYNDIAGGPGVSDPYLQGFVVLAGKGDGTFSNTAILTSTYAGTSAPATALAATITQTPDVNGDGSPDLVATVPAFSTASGATVALNVYLSNGDGTFHAPATVNIAANVYGLPVVADVNGDNKPDLVFIAETAAGNGEIGIAHGNGDGTFANATTIPLADGDEVRGDGLAAADFNGDGHVDLALIDNIRYGGLFYGKGDGTFVSVPQGNYVVPKDLLNLSAGSPAVAADINGDGKPDVLAGNVVLLGAAAPAVTTPTASTTTTLQASATTITAGASVTFTATVAPTSGSGTPTGNVTFLNGSTTLGTGTLSSTGVATYTTTTLPTGSDSITAAYGGDSNFSGSTSSAVTVTVNAVVVNPTFALSNSGNITVSPGATSANTSTISVKGAGGFNAAVALTCAVTPSAASDPAACSLSPASVTVSGATAQTSMLTVTTTAAANAERGSKAEGDARWYYTGGATLACLLLCGLPARRRRWQNLLGMLLLLAFASTAFVACGGSSNNSGGGGGGSKTTGDPGTTAGTYTVTVTGTSGATTETTAVSVVVN